MLAKKPNMDMNLNWKVFLFSLDKPFQQIFVEATNSLVFQNNKVTTQVESNPLTFIENVTKLDMLSVIHINADRLELSLLLDWVRLIKSDKNLKLIQLIVWMEEPWVLLDLDFIAKYGINDLRTTKNESQKRIAYIVKTNLINQKNLLDVIQSNDGLELKVQKRTETLTNTNKKLQSYVIQNGNINTKLQQQKNEMEEQRAEAVSRNEDIERAFKKSSKQHIRLHKVMMENEEHRKQIEEAFEEIKAKNDKLVAQNEEIKSQRDHIEQQHEEIQSQRDLAIEQRDAIVRHQAEIRDNIVYARRIQQALLPPKDLVKQILPKHFVFNQPKDIVSGDFYWVAQNRRYSVIAVADCTGHGISGAMMSMLATGYLNEIVNKNDITSSAVILGQLRERIISSLHQNEGEGIDYSRDGLDISLCVIDIMDGKLEYSGANNPLYLIRNGELLELKPDKMPIGIHEFSDKPFSSQIIDLEQDDCVFLFSDGYPDQFGGSKGKKLKYSRFRQILLEGHGLSSNDQLNELSSRFFNWMGENEQVDDVLVLGFKAL